MSCQPPANVHTSIHSTHAECNVRVYRPVICAVPLQGVRLNELSSTGLLHTTRIRVLKGETSSRNPSSIFNNFGVLELKFASFAML